MTEIDWIICALLVLSTVVGIMRGVIREVLSIVGWVAGFMLSMSFAGEIADRIPLDSIGYIPRVIIAAVLILVACLFVVGLFGFILRKMLEVAALTFEDRILGAAFGFVRGIIVVAACVFFFGLHVAAVRHDRTCRDRDRVGDALHARVDSGAQRHEGDGIVTNFIKGTLHMHGPLGRF